jgi:hypothetical protein
MPAFITHIEPVHPLEGKEVRFFFRELENGVYRSKTIVKEIPHYFYTPNINHQDIRDLEQRLREDSDFSHLKFQAYGFSKEKSFLRAEGSKEDRKILPEPFICKPRTSSRRDPLGLNSPSRQLRWAYPPGMKVDPENIPLPSEIRRREFMGLDFLVSQHYGVGDIEIKLWEIGKDEIFMVVYKSPNGLIIYHNLPHDLEKVDEVPMIKFNTQPELGDLLTTQIITEDPLTLMGHNFMNFDQMKVHHLTRTYLPATNAYKPVTKSAQGLGRVNTKGRLTFDTYTYHFNYRNILLDNKLGTVTGSEKILGQSGQSVYAEQSDLVVKAQAGDEDAFKKLVRYCIKDGFDSEKLGLEMLEVAMAKSLHFRRDLDSISSTSKLNVAEDYWQRRYFQKKGNFVNTWKKVRDKKLFSLDEYKQEFLPKGFKQGYLDDCHVVYLTPFIGGSVDFLRQNSPWFMKKFESSEDPLEKLDIMQTLNAELAYLVREINGIIKGDFIQDAPDISRKQEFILDRFFENHSIKMDPLEFMENIRIAMKETNEALEYFDIINRGSLLYLLQGDLRNERLEERFFGCYLGTGKALSLSPNSFVANPFDEDSLNRFVYQGFSPTKGRKCNFEKRMLVDVINRIFSGEEHSEIAKSLSKQISAFVNGENELEDYVFPIKTQTYYKNLLLEVFAKAEVDGKIVDAYKDIKHRIGNRFSPEVKRELGRIRAICHNNHAFPFIEEVVEKIFHPYPLQTNLVYTPMFEELISEEWSMGLDLARYQTKIQDTFGVFHKVLGPKQGDLVLG